MAAKWLIIVLRSKQPKNLQVRADEVVEFLIANVEFLVGRCKLGDVGCFVASVCLDWFF